MDVATQAFKNADSYDSARKGYPINSAKLFLSKLQETPKQFNGNNNKDRTILELGAGTGQFSKVLVEATKETDFTVVSSEPLESMGKVFRKSLPNVELICCSGDKIPLPDSSIDAVVAANTLHYLANVESFTEIARVLKPGGILAFVCNYVDIQKVPWAQAIYDLSAKFYSRVGIKLSFDENGITNDWEKMALNTGFYQKVQKDFFFHSDNITEEETVRMFMSYGAFYHCDETEREDVRSTCENILKENYSGAGKTMTEIPMRCSLYWMEKK
ncbi:putative methyltransferase-like C25B8.10 [Exaiptasia diaphana]|nr:putative methyltransferase-like C25B8.10 [Exaiptasia diaphana]